MATTTPEPQLPTYEATPAAAAEAPDDWSRWAMVVYTGPQDPAASGPAASPVTPAVAGSPASAGSSSTAPSRSEAPSLAGAAGEAPPHDDSFFFFLGQTPPDDSRDRAPAGAASSSSVTGGVGQSWAKGSSAHEIEIEISPEESRMYWHQGKNVPPSAGPSLSETGEEIHPPDKVTSEVPGNNVGPAGGATATPAHQSVVSSSAELGAPTTAEVFGSSADGKPRFGYGFDDGSAPAFFYPGPPPPYPFGSAAAPSPFGSTDPSPFGSTVPSLFGSSFGGTGPGPFGGTAASPFGSTGPSSFRGTVSSPFGSTAPGPFGEVVATIVGESGTGTSTTWDLPSKILRVAELPPQDGCIWRVDASGLPPEACKTLVVDLGPLFFPPMGKKGAMEETKLKYVHNLIRRAHQDVELKLVEYLTHVSKMGDHIRQRYDRAEYNENPTELVELMVLDGLFIIEVLINHWTGKIDEAGSTEVKKDEDFTPQKLRWEPHALRLDLIVVQNQIPFFVLEELFHMTDIPELRGDVKESAKLKEMVLDYVVGDADDTVLAGYQGPVYHILHLVYLHLTFSQRASTLHPDTVPPSVFSRAFGKLERRGMDLRALCKRTFSRSSDLPVGWKQWKVIPPLRELVRVGVKLKRAETARFAEVRFRNGVLEIPPFAWRRYHVRLLTNLVVLEMSGWWPPEKRVFCSYVRFMSELIVKKEDAALLFKKGIVQEINVNDIDNSLIKPFLTLADYSHGSKYECRFDGLVRDMVKCYQTWSKVGSMPRTRR